MKNLILFLGFFLTASCVDKQKDISFLQKEITSINDWYQTVSDTLYIDTFYDVETSNDILLEQVNSVIEISKEKFWVSDFLGKVIELDANGRFTKTILKTGKGPQEVLKPIGLTKSSDNTIYVFDGGQQIFIELDTLGNELKRVKNASIPSTVMSISPVVLDENRLLWNKIFHDKFALIEWDSLGNFKEGWIENIIPLGKQPIMLNNLVYDYDYKMNTLLYAFKPLPIIFMRNEVNETNGVYLGQEINLRELEEITSEKKEDGNNGVKNLIKAVFKVGSNTVVAYNNNILVLPDNKTNAVVEFVLANDSNEKPIFHYGYKTQHHFFLIDAYNRKIYNIPLEMFDKI
jgi:hypothetical protein